MRSKRVGVLLSAALILAVAFGVALKVSAGQMSEAIQSATISTDTRLSASQSVDPCISASSKWALWTGGTCLRGANVWKTLVLPYLGGTFGAGPYGPVYTQADFNALAALGANLVNISGPGLYSETAPYGLNADAQADIDNVLAMTKNANMFAIITARSGPGYNMDFDAGTPGERHSIWTSQAEQDGWVAMWKYTADRYKDNPIVVGYDLMVEPHSDTLLPGVNTPSDFYPAYASTLYDWNPLAKRISDAIRQVDTNTPILVAGMGWSATNWLSSLTSNSDSKTVYMAHQYEPQEAYTHQAAPYTNSYGTTTGTFTRADLLTYFSYISSFKSSRNVPVGVNEFGVQRYEPGAAQFLDDEFALLESNGLNYAIYSWDPADLVTTEAIYDGFDYRKGTDPNNHVDVSPNELTTVLQKYFSKSTVRPSNIGAVTQTGANNCAATVSSSLVVHIPIVTFSGANYWADLQYNSVNSTLTVTNAGIVNDASSYSNCTASTLSSDLKLHIPVIILNGLSYWADLQYSGSAFAVTGYGQN